MKRADIKIFLSSALILLMACCIGASSVSALSADGESLLSELMSAGSSVGGGIVGDIVDNYVTTTEPETTIVVPEGENAEEELGKILDQIGLSSDVLLITDLVAYLNRGGSLQDWIYDNYGKDIEIPASVKAMSSKELVLYLMGTILYPDQTTGTTNADKHVFVPSVTETTAETASVVTTTAPTTVTTSRETTTERFDYVTGDIDSDGKVTAKDARLALRAAASVDKLYGASFHAADVNGDGRITANDARSILRYAAKITSGF